MSASIPTVPVVVSVVIAIVTTLSATSLTSVEERPLAVEWPYMRLAKWSNGALIDVEYDRTVNPLVWLFEGQVQRTVPFTIPGARLMEIDDWDRAADGAIGDRCRGPTQRIHRLDFPRRNAVGSYPNIAVWANALGFRS